MKRAFQEVEDLRLHCLQQMGISSYHPRFLLPGALPSSLLPGSAPPAAASAEVVPEATGPLHEVAADRALAGMPHPHEGAADEAWVEAAADYTPATRAQRGGDAMPPAPSPYESGIESSNAPDHQPSARSATAGTRQESLQFQLLLVHIDAELAVLLQIPALARPMLQPRQAQLLQNMLRWLGLSTGLSPQPRRFQWPLPGMKTPEGAAAAALGLRHFVEQAAVEQPFRRLLLLGQQLADQLAGHSVVPAALPLISTHSLDELLAVPALKREAWQALLPLHAALLARRP